MAGEPDGQGGGVGSTPGGAGRQGDFDFLGYYDQQIAAKDKEIEDTRRFEKEAEGYLGNDQRGTSLAVPMERERDNLVALRERFADANETGDAFRQAQQGNPWPLAGRVAQDPVLGTLAGAGIGGVLGRVGGALGRGAGRLGGRAAATDAAAAKPAAAPTPVQLCPPEIKPQPTAAEQVRVLPGHGNARHGDQTTMAEQTTRVLTDVAPDGKRSPTKRATRFDSPEAQLDAVNRAMARTQARDAAGDIPNAITVNRRGVARLPTDTSVVTGFPGGYGSGVQRQPGSSSTVVPTGQDQNARVTLERDPLAGAWRPVTQFPTNEPLTP